MDFSYLDDWMEEEIVPEEAADAGEGYRNIWALVEVGDGSPLPASLAAIGQAQELARQIGVYAYALLLGEGVEALGQDLIAHGADQVLIADDPALGQYQAEAFVEVLASLVAQYRPEILLLAATPMGNDLAPRLAQRLGTGLISHCIGLDLDMAERLLLGTSPALAGEVYHTFACPSARPQMATLEPGYFPKPYLDEQRAGKIELVELDQGLKAGRLNWVALDARFDLEPEPLNRAKVVVAGGRGMGDAEGFALVERLARALGGVVAGSRGAYDEGWVAEDRIVGVGGTFVAPDLYVACGLSGDIYHHFGLQDAQFIVAINTDENAPIMRVANVGIVGDARQVIPAVLQALAEAPDS
jgi:electron transfer flavoprotein alpha subunit